MKINDSSFQAQVLTALALLQSDVSTLKKDNVKVHNKLKKMHQDINMVIDFFDKENLHGKKRLDRVENILNLPEMPYVFG